MHAVSAICPWATILVYNSITTMPICMVCQEGGGHIVHALWLLHCGDFSNGCIIFQNISDICPHKTIIDRVRTHDRSTFSKIEHKDRAACIVYFLLTVKEFA